MDSSNRPLRVSIVATPDAQVTPLSGLYEVLGAFELLAGLAPELPRRPFQVEIVAASHAPTHGASGLPIAAHCTVAEVEHTDIAIVPLMMFSGPEWETGRQPEIVEWLRRMHHRGALLCSTCTGVLLLAETGLLQGREATIHWAFAPTFRRNFPDVGLRLEEVLITADNPERFVMTGGVTSWHDLALHLITRYVGVAAAQAMARLMLLHWHPEGQAPYIGFMPGREHGDSAVAELQRWIEANLSAANPIEEMTRRSSLSMRSLERRFMKATGHSPIAYVQNLRIEAAKRQLERTDKPVETISYEIGYENPAFFRRLFKRRTRLTPGQYRQRFTTPPVPQARS